MQSLLTNTFGCRSDADEFYHYQMRFYNDIFFPYLEANNIKTLINCGDFTDRRKYINFNTLHRFRNDYIYKLRDMGVHQHNIIGNHDTFFKNSNKVNSMTELFSGVDNFHIYPDPTEVEFDGVKMLFLPWMCDDNVTESMEMIDNTTAKIVFGHLEIRNFEMYRGTPMHEGFDESLYSKFEAVYSGHYHHKSSRNNIHYLGAPCEYTWSDYADDRGFHVFDTDTCTMEYIKNPYRIFHKISYDDSTLTIPEQKVNLISKFSGAVQKYKDCHVKVLVTKKTDLILFEEFIDKLYKVNPADVSIVESVHENITEDDVSVEILSQDTLSILTGAVDSVTILDDEEKENLRAFMNELYVEALQAKLETG